MGKIKNDAYKKYPIVINKAWSMDTSYINMDRKPKDETKFGANIY